MSQRRLSNLVETPSPETPNKVFSDFGLSSHLEGWGLTWRSLPVALSRTRQKEQRRRRAGKLSSKTVFLESPFLLCTLI